jgi:hypothetical protein
MLPSRLVVSHISRKTSEMGGTQRFVNPSASLLMTKKARRALWYPTQARTGLEWGTQRSAAGWENRRSLGFARDDKGECGASSGSMLVG